MKKRTLILTDKQLNEITGAYCSNSDSTHSNANGNEVFCSDFVVDLNGNDSYGEPITTDDYADDITNDVGALWKIGGVSGNLVMRENNRDLENRKFNGKSYDAVRKTKERFEKAQIMARSEDEITKRQGIQTMEKMQQNDPDIYTTINQYEAGKNASKSLRQMKVQNGEQVLASKPKQSGNGMAHSKKNNNITITYF